ncbi:MAG: hypothetical protein QOH14_24 [Pseudonocardiales bacterium]|nr:hypothetical protein [Pseudonocardiales bacterium]
MTGRIGAMSIDGTPISQADVARMEADEALHAAWQRKAVRVVAASAIDADDCRLLLSVLGLDHEVIADARRADARRTDARRAAAAPTAGGAAAGSAAPADSRAADAAAAGTSATAGHSGAAGTAGAARTADEAKSARKRRAATAA